MMVLKYWMMKERILNRNYSSASNWNPSFLVDDLKKLGMLFNEIFFENLPIRTERGNKGRPDSRTNPGGLWYIIGASMPCSRLLIVISPTQFSQTPSTTNNS